MNAHSPHLAVPVVERDHVQGPADAPVTLVEYGDFECPYTGRAYPIIKQVQRALGDQLRLVFRNFPLTDIHPHAQQAAEAAEAAGAQGKYWEMHDLLFEHQKALNLSDLLGYARQLDLDVARFERDLAGRAYAARVGDDVAGAERSGVEGTPTFFVNGRRHDGSFDADTLLRTIRGAAR